MTKRSIQAAVSRLTSGVLTLALAGCATPTLVPAPSAELASGDDSAIVGRAQAVELIVEADAWSAFPRSLEERLTPIKATLINNSDEPIEVKYEHFALSGFDGATTYHPLPPIDIKGTITQTARQPVFVPRFGYRGFVVAPYLYTYYDPYFAAVSPWAYRPFDPLYYRRYYPMWEVDLPTPEMVEMAIPEGVIEPGGQVSGFLYFPELTQADEGDRVTLSAQVVNAREDETLGRIEIPFVIE